MREPPPKISQDADDALERARNMPPGPDRMEALRKAGILREAAATSGTVFPPSRRGPK